MSFRRAVKRIIEEIPEYPDPVPIPQELPCCISPGDSPQKHLTFKSLQNERDSFRQLSLKTRERDISSETLNKLRNFENEWNSSRDLFRRKSDTSPLMKSRNMSSERIKIDSSKLLIEIANATSAALRKVQQFEERKEEPIQEERESNVRILDIRKVRNKKTLESTQLNERQGAKSLDFKFKPSSTTPKSTLNSCGSITPYDYFLSKYTEEDSLTDLKIVEEKTESILTKNIDIKVIRSKKRNMSTKEIKPRMKLGMHTPRAQATPVDLSAYSPLNGSEIDLLSKTPSKTPEFEERCAKSSKIKITTTLYKKTVKNQIGPVLRNPMVDSPHLGAKTTSPVKQIKSPYKSEGIRPKKRDPVLVSPKCTKYKTLPVTLTKEPENTKKVNLQISKGFALSIESTISIPKQESKPELKEDTRITHKPARDSRAIRKSPQLIPSKDKRNSKITLAESNPSVIELSASKDLTPSSKEIKEMSSKEDLLKKMPNLKAYATKAPRTCTADIFNDSGTDEKNGKSRKLNRRQQEDLISRLVGNSARRRLFLYK